VPALRYCLREPFPAVAPPPVSDTVEPATVARKRSQWNIENADRLPSCVPLTTPRVDGPVYPDLQAAKLANSDIVEIFFGGGRRVRGESSG
jgi:hypothetical protein